MTARLEPIAGADVGLATSESIHLTLAKTFKRSAEALIAKSDDPPTVEDLAELDRLIEVGTHMAQQRGTGAYRAARGLVADLRLLQGWWAG